MVEPEWLELTRALFAPAYTDMMFTPFRESLKLLVNQDFSLTNGSFSDRMNTVKNISEKGYICTDSDDECRADNPATCWKHGGISTPFTPTAKNTKQFKVYDWMKAARKPGISIDAIEINGEAAGLMATRFDKEDKANGAVYIDLLERAGADDKGKGGENKGIGERLIASAVNKAVDNGVDAVYLKPVTTAIPTYRRLGFKSAGPYMLLEGKEFDKYRRK